MEQVATRAAEERIGAEKFILRAIKADLLDGVERKRAKIPREKR